MEIREESKGGAADERVSFEFTPIPDDGKLFPAFKAKDTKDLLFKWGLTEANFKFAKFRFNQAFHLIGADNFLRDLFNSKYVQGTFEPVAGVN